MPIIRSELSLITESAPINNHPKLVHALKGRLQHSIKCIPSGWEIEKYTCIMHAFGLVGDTRYEAIASFGIGRVFAGKAFVEFLIANSLLVQRPNFKGLPGDLIVYLADTEFCHVGRMLQSGRVVSKWGTGWLYEHSIWEVPNRYGNQIQYYVNPGDEESLDLFRRYAESVGLKFRRGDIESA